MKGPTRWMATAAALACFSGVAPARDNPTWIGTWATSPAGLPTLTKIGTRVLPVPTLVRGTFRFRLRISLGGRQIRLRFSNEYGDSPLTLNAVTVGIAADGLDAAPGSLHKVTFAASEVMTLPAGAPALSDPIDLPVKASGDLVVSVYVRDGVSAFHCTQGEVADQAAVEDSNATLVEHLSVDKCLDLMRPVVSEVDVLADHPRKVIVTLGDSITDGDVDPKTGERGWPGALARRLQDAKIAVANAGIGGNRLLQSLPMFGVSALSRLDRDVFAVPGVTHIVVLEGINDIRTTGAASVLGDLPMVEPQALIAAYSQIIARAHERGIKVIGATMLPFGGAGYYTVERENVRMAVNEWIRTAKKFDGVIDFDAAMRDPGNPQKIKPQYDSGDHLHPNFDGYRQMGERVDLGLFN